VVDDEIANHCQFLMVDDSQLFIMVHGGYLLPWLTVDISKLLAMFDSR
jgi:hypothetical protein